MDNPFPLKSWLQVTYPLMIVASLELFSLALTAEALQGKTCQDTLLSGEGRSLGARFQGEGVVPVE